MTRPAHLLLAALLAATSAAGAGPESDVAFRGALEGALRDALTRCERAGVEVDREGLFAEAVRRRAAGEAPETIRSWLNREIRRATLAFAPVRAVHDGRVLYDLPFDPLYPRPMLGGVGKGMHQDRQRYAFDFVMPIGTPVRAAREGVVALVVDGFEKGGIDRSLSLRANELVVLHSDGTFAIYYHLAPGIRVRKGDRVERGQELARSGNTGFSHGPHLHFSVARVDPDGAEDTSVPIRFRGPAGKGFVPEDGAYLGWLPAPTVDLELFANGAPVRPGVAVPVRWGAKVQLRVEAVSKGPRSARDVTRDPGLELVSMTPWNLDVVGPGQVVIRPMAEFPVEGVSRPDGTTVGVFFLNRSAGEIGLGKVDFAVTGVPGAAR